MGERRAVYRVSVGRPLGRRRRRWEDNIKTDLQEVECGGYVLDRSGSGQGQVAAVVYPGILFGGGVQQI